MHENFKKTYSLLIEHFWQIKQYLVESSVEFEFVVRFYVLGERSLSPYQPCHVPVAMTFLWSLDRPVYIIWLQVGWANEQFSILKTSGYRNRLVDTLTSYFFSMQIIFYFNDTHELIRLTRLTRNDILNLCE